MSFNIVQSSTRPNISIAKDAGKMFRFFNSVWTSPAYGYSIASSMEIDPISPINLFHQPLQFVHPILPPGCRIIPIPPYRKSKNKNLTKKERQREKQTISTRTLPWGNDSGVDTFRNTPSWALPVMDHWLSSDLTKIFTFYYLIFHSYRISQLVKFYP